MSIEKTKIQFTSDVPVEARSLGITPNFAYLFKVKAFDVLHTTGMTKTGETFAMYSIELTGEVVQAVDNLLPEAACRGQTCRLRLTTNKGEPKEALLSYFKQICIDCKFDIPSYESTEVIEGAVIGQGFFGKVKTRNDFPEIDVRSLRVLNA